jgi:uncharacterized membrane protein YhaH (DUF805 family)
VNARSWTLLALLALSGAVIATYFAFVFRAIDCSEESYSTCSTSGLVQLVIAAAGLVPALAMMTQSLRGRGRPSRWFVATVVVYATWFLYLWFGPEFGAG